MLSIFPIREISTYNGKNWTIKARVTSKSQLRTFANDRGQGKVFSVDLLDKDGGEIKASFFNSSCDKFFNEIDVGKIYTFSRGNVKVANKKYSSSKHNYEINFDSDAVILASNDDDASIENVRYNFCKIRDISGKALPCTVDLVGVVKDVKPIGKVQSKNVSSGGGDELTRRTITVVDDTECAIDITLWQESATKFDESILANKPVIAIKGLSVKEYNGARTLGTLQQSVIDVSGVGELDSTRGFAATDACKSLVSWWSNSPNIGDFFNLSSGANGISGTPGAPGSEIVGGGSAGRTIMSIADMREECKRGFFGDKGIYFDIIAKLSFVSTKSKDGDIPIYYSACSSCNRKLSDDGTFRCFACDKTISNPKKKYLLRAQFIDHSDQCYLSVFDAQAVTVLKKSVDDLLASVGTNSSSVPDELKRSYFEKNFHLRVRAMAQEYKGEMRPRVTVVAADPVDCVSMGNRLLKKIIDKVGVDKKLDRIDENMKPANSLDDEEMQPDPKKMRMMNDDMDVDGVPIESKE
jgi:replication factor A1